MKIPGSTLIILAAAAGLLLAGAGCVQSGDYRAFIYKDRVAYAFNPGQASVKAAGPAFQNLRDCQAWASKEAAKDGNVPYRCGYRCQYDKQYDEVVCQDDAPVRPPGS